MDPKDRIRDEDDPLTTGFRNLGATCFMNALFQALYATKPFRMGLWRFRAPSVLPKGETEASLKTKLEVIHELQIVFGEMQEGNALWLRPDAFPRLLEFPTNEQQDVCLICLSQDGQQEACSWFKLGL